MVFEKSGLGLEKIGGLGLGVVTYWSCYITVWMIKCQRYFL